MRFSFYGHMVCFLNCHLAAHMNYALQRVDELEHILETQDFHLTDTPHIQDHKSVQLHTRTHTDTIQLGVIMEGNARLPRLSRTGWSSASGT